MNYTIIVKAPRGHLRRQCRRTSDGRYIFFEGVRSRREVMEMARRAADFAESVHVVWNSTRTLSRGWRLTPSAMNQAY
jgi:hypothetical protein